LAEYAPEPGCICPDPPLTHVAIRHGLRDEDRQPLRAKAAALPPLPDENLDAIGDTLAEIRLRSRQRKAEDARRYRATGCPVHPPGRTFRI
jgi:hypothetical protein